MEFHFTWKPKLVGISLGATWTTNAWISHSHLVTWGARAKEPKANSKKGAFFVISLQNTGASIEWMGARAK